MADWARKLNVQVYALRVQPLEVFRWFQIRSRCQHTSGLCCHSEGPLQAGEIRQMESSKAQQEKKSPAQWGLLLSCLDNSFIEKDLDVLVDKLNVLPQCTLIWESILGCIRKWIVGRSVRVQRQCVNFHLGKRKVTNAWKVSKRVTDDRILRFLSHLLSLELSSVYLGKV